MDLVDTVDTGKRERKMIEPFYSPKMAAYAAVLNKIKNYRLKRGTFPDDYTRYVNREIDGIRVRLKAAANRLKGEEGIQKMCAADPDFAEVWKKLKLQNGYFNAVKREHQLAKKLSEMASESDGSDRSDNPGGRS